MLLIIFGYFLASIIIGFNQYVHFEGLSTVYLVSQWIILGVSVFCTLFFHNRHHGVGDFLATVGGGIAMMDIIQAILFYVLGGFITSDLSLTKTILLVVIAIVIIIFVYRYLTKSPR